MSTPRRIVIAGGGTAGWMAAAAMARTLGRAVTVTLVESDAIGTIGVGESTIPPIITFNRLLGINEAEFMAATQATFKLGIQFDGWKGPEDRYFHSFGLTGKDHWAAGFQHFWLDGRARGHDASYDEYCLELVAAREGRFAHLPDERMNYAYQLDSTLYGRFLRRMAEGDGATRIEGRIAQVDLDPDTGDIAALVLDDGRRVEGDLFLDCTGFRALLIERALHVGFDDWSHYLPCDAAVAVQTESVRPPVPYTRAIAHEAGWQWRIPLQHRAGNGIVYCSRYMDHDTARETLLATVEGKVLTQPNMLRFQTGARRKQWHRNCIAVGLSGGFLEPLESTSIHLIQAGIAKLLAYFPTRTFEPEGIREYNRVAITEYERIRDFLILHYKLTERTDAPLWRECAAMAIPDTLAMKIAHFRTAGRLVARDMDLFGPASWAAVHLGQFNLPEGLDPLLAYGDPAQSRAFVGKLAGAIGQMAESMPSHGDWLKRIGATP